MLAVSKAETDIENEVSSRFDLNDAIFFYLISNGIFYTNLLEINFLLSLKFIFDVNTFLCLNCLRFIRSVAFFKFMFILMYCKFTKYLIPQIFSFSNLVISLNLLKQ